MKVLATFIVLMIIMGCTGSAIVIPDEPKLEGVQAYRFDQFVCFDAENEAALQRNMTVILEYVIKLRKELLRKQEEGL